MPLFVVSRAFVYRAISESPFFVPGAVSGAMYGGRSWGYFSRRKQGSGMDGRANAKSLKIFIPQNAGVLFPKTPEYLSPKRNNRYTISRLNKRFGGWYEQTKILFKMAKKCYKK